MNLKGKLIFFSLSSIVLLLTACAQEPPTQTVPTAQDIQEAFRASKQPGTEFFTEDNLESIDINAMSGKEATLFAGILGSYAEEYDDFGFMYSLAKDLSSNLSENLLPEDFASIISDDTYSDYFRFMMMDCSHFLTDTEGKQYSSAELDVIDQALLGLLEENQFLTFDALANIKNQDLITQDILYNLLEVGTENVQRLALEKLVEIYPAEGLTYCEKIVNDSSLQDTKLYESALYLRNR